jgi:hypothetical protein
MMLNFLDYFIEKSLNIFVYTVMIEFMNHMIDNFATGRHLLIATTPSWSRRLACVSMQYLETIPDDNFCFFKKKLYTPTSKISKLIFCFEKNSDLLFEKKI